MRKLRFIIGILGLFLYSCGGSSNGGGEDNNTPSGTDLPNKVSLIDPVDNMNCLGSNVTFNWRTNVLDELAQLNFKIYVTNVLSKDTTEYLVTRKDTHTIKLLENTYYSWYIEGLTSSGAAGEKSDTYFFITSKDVIEQSIPQAAKLSNPENNSLAASSKNLSLVWDSYDADGDISHHVLYLSPFNPPSEKYGENISADRRSISVSLNDGITYYWRIETVDNKGNKSTSRIQKFTTP